MTREPQSSREEGEGLPFQSFLFFLLHDSFCRTLKLKLKLLSFILVHGLEKLRVDERPCQSGN